MCCNWNALIHSSYTNSERSFVRDENNIYKLTETSIQVNFDPLQNFGPKVGSGGSFVKLTVFMELETPNAKR